MSSRTGGKDDGICREMDARTGLWGKECGDGTGLGGERDGRRGTRAKRRGTIGGGRGGRGGEIRTVGGRGCRRRGATYKKTRTSSAL